MSVSKRLGKSRRGVRLPDPGQQILDFADGMISKPILSHRKARYQRILDELEEVSRVAIPEEGYELPSDKQLRHVMRLFALSSRRGRRGHFDAPFILMHKQDPIGKAELAEFVLKRLHLTPGREVGNAPPKKKTI